MQVPHPSDIKENYVTGSECLPSIIMNNINKYAELNSVKKASKEARHLFCSGHIMSVKFNPITSSLKHFFVKGVAPRHRRVLIGILTVFGFAFMMMAQF